MEILKRNYKYILFFLVVFLSLMFFGSNNTDIIWNYGMAHAIRLGEIPYKDFNIITTPLYAFIMSIFLVIHDSYTVFLLAQAFLCTIFIFIVSKLIPGKVNFLCFFMFFPIFYFIFPNYNFLVFFLMTLLILLEERKTNDYLIGFVLGLLILSKHTIGLVVLFCSLISTLDIKRGRKRLLSCLGVLSVYCVYLLLTGSFYSFLDLGVFGLFDFGNSNKYYSVFCIVSACLMFIYTIYSFIKDKSYLNFYLLGSFSFIIPINDMFHMNYLICFFVLIVLMKHKLPDYLKSIFTALIGVTFLLNIFINWNLLSNMRLLDDSYFNNYLVTKERDKYIKNILIEYKSYDNSYMLAMSSMFFDIASNHQITNFSIPLYGNFGYDGINKMKEKINKMHDVYFFLEDNSNRQYANELNDYVRKVGKKIKNVESMEIYYIK